MEQYKRLSPPVQWIFTGCVQSKSGNNDSCIQVVLETNASVIKSQKTVSEHDIYLFTIVILKMKKRLLYIVLVINEID